MSEITVSICLCGRNDNYGHDFKRRFTQSMNFLAWSAKKAGYLDRIEVVFTDWNSDLPISSEMVLSEDAANMIRFLEVPPQYARPLNAPHSPFHTGKSLNAAFRRAKGVYVGMMPADVLITRFSLDSLFRILDCKWDSLSFDPKKAVMSLPRKNMSCYAEEAFYFVTPEETERILCEADSYLPMDCFKGLMAGYGLFLIHRDLMEVVGGFNESIGGWGISDTDIGLRLANIAPTVNLGAYGVCCYDFETDASMRNEKNARKADESFHCRLVSPSDSVKWGLPDLTLHESKAKSGKTVFPLAHEKEMPRISNLLFHARFMDGALCGRPSRAALELSRKAAQIRPKRILFRRLPDPTAVFMAVQVCPMADLVIQDGSAENLKRFLAADYVLKEGHHHGHVTMIPNDNAKEVQGQFDLILLQEGGDEPEYRKKLTSSGILLSGLPENAGKPKSIARFYKLFNILSRLPCFSWWKTLFELHKQ